MGSVINGKFHIERAIARGGMGRIYYGTQAPLNRPVALKIVKADSVNEEESQFLKRFLLEASILAKLQHPNVVTLFDYGRIEGASVEMYFIAMEYLDGETLTDRLRTRGALPALDALVVFRQIARGLREAHARGIVHRDLKPSNIMLMPEADGEIVKLVDFGIGKDEGGGEDLTRDGVLVGTPKYMAPEQFDGHSSAASDVYALGLIMYQLLTGSIPFNGNTMAEFMIAKLQHPVPPMRDLNPICDATDALEHLVNRMLARRPEERPTIDEVFGLLAQCEDEIFGSSGARLAMTKSSARHAMGGPIGSRPASIGALKVPYTIVAPQPMIPSLTPPPSIPSVTPMPGRPVTTTSPVVTGFTPRPISTTTSPPGSRGVPLPAVLAIVVALLSMGAGGLWLVKSRLTPKTPTASATVEAPPLDTGVRPEPPAPAHVTTFVLRIDSTPSGATVTEDGVTLGTTPLDLTIDKSTVADGKRTFQIKKDGHVPGTWSQGDSDHNLSAVVMLAPESTRAVKSPSHAGGGGRSSNQGGGSKTPPPPHGESDIRLKR